MVEDACRCVSFIGSRLCFLHPGKCKPQAKAWRQRQSQRLLVSKLVSQVWPKPALCSIALCASTPGASATFLDWWPQSNDVVKLPSGAFLATHPTFPRIACRIYMQQPMNSDRNRYFGGTMHPFAMACSVNEMHAWPGHYTRATFLYKQHHAGT